MSQENRLNWNDKDWAAYLGCSVFDVARYRWTLAELFLMAIARSENTGKYHFEMYKYETTPLGFKRTLLQYSGKKEFDSLKEAVKDANESIISNPTFVLDDLLAKQYKLPAKAIQMMLIKQR